MTGGRPATLHERLLTELRDNILRGHWQPGERIPFETELAARQGVSRMTMNKVLTQLAREGYLERRRRVGTFVARPRLQSAVMTIADIGEEVRRRGAAYAFATIAREHRPAGAADRMALRCESGGADVLAIECVHSADGEPFCHEARLISLAAVPAALGADFTAEPPGTWLLHEVPWSAAEHRISATAPAPGIARHLAIPPSAPCLVIERHTDFEGRPITFARLTYRGDRHQLVARFLPAAGPGAALQG